MASRWPSERLERVAEVVMGQSPPGHTYNERGEGLPFYQGVRDFGERFPSRRVYCSEPTRAAEQGDILFSVRAPIGKVNRSVEHCAIGRGVAAIRGRRPQDTTFIEFALRSMAHQWVVLEGGGSVFGAAKRSDLLGLEVPWPPEPVRRTIAATLESLDDKIELNRRMADTLDEIAKTLFRTWFVEPAGRAWPSGGEGLPEGWKVERIGEHVDAVRGLSYSSANLGEPGEGLPMHNLNSISFARGYQPSGLKWFMGPHKDRNRAVAGELLVANVDVTQNLEVIGSPAIVPLRFGDDSVFSADLFRVDLKAGAPLTVRYLYMLLRDPRFHRIVVGFANGTTVNHLPSDALSVPRIVVPPRDLVDQFDKVVRPMLERRDELESESDTLREIRDTLLPPLLDGRIEVPASADGEAS